MAQDRKEYMKAYNESRKEDMKAYYQAHKEEINSNHKEYMKSYIKSDVNSLGQSKHIIRMKSNYYLKKYGTKIPGYQIHHCCTYNEPYKFIYCSKEMLLKIHQYLRDNNIEADNNHFEQIKHLLDNTVVLYGV